MNGVNEGRTIVKFRRVPKLLYVSVHRLIHDRHGHFDKLVILDIFRVTDS